MVFQFPAAAASGDVGRSAAGDVAEGLTGDERFLRIRQPADLVVAMKWHTVCCMLVMDWACYIKSI